MCAPGPPACALPRQPVARRFVAWRKHSLCKASLGRQMGASPLPLAPGTASSAARGWGRRPSPDSRARARWARDAPCTRPCARPAAPAQRSDPPSLPQSAPRGRRHLPRAGSSVHGAHAALPEPRGQLEEDAWAREYRGGGGGERAGMECRRKKIPRPAPPRGRLRSPAPGRRPRPPPRPAPPPAHTRRREKGREGTGGRQ